MSAERIALVCEGPDDFRRVTTLFDHLLVREVEWIEPSVLDSFRTWNPGVPGGEYIAWEHVRAIARERGVRFPALGRNDGLHDYRAMHKALILLTQLHIDAEAPFSLAVIVRDTDKEPSRKLGLERAEEERNSPFSVVMGVAIPKSEAWVLALLEPESEQEWARIAQLRQELGHDPRERTETLFATGKTDKRNAKRVLHALIDTPNHERETRALRFNDWSIVEARAKKNGLEEFVKSLSALVRQVWARRT